MDQQAALDLPLMGVLGDGEEVEVVRVFQDLFGKIGAGRRESPLEVRQGLPFPFMQPGVDLEREHALAPAVLERSPEVPLSCGPVFDLVQNPDVVAPG